MQQIAILGLGLIGTSIGLGLRAWAARQAQSTLHIVGYDADLGRQRQARSMHAIDEDARDLPSAVRSADVVILAVPVGAVQEVMQDAAPHLRAGATVTDVASVKGAILRWAGEYLPATVSFVGGHPMAGATGSIEAAKAELFVGARWCITPAPRASESAVEAVVGLVSALGATSYFIDADEHDGLVAGISHLPFAVAAALTTVIAEDNGWREMKDLAAGGYRDTTRLAEGSPIMHRDIVLANRAALLRLLDALAAELVEVRGLVAAGEPEALESFFEHAQDVRIRWRLERERQAAGKGPSEGQPVDVPSLGESMQRMLFGGFGQKRRPSEQENRKER